MRALLRAGLTVVGTALVVASLGGLVALIVASPDSPVSWLTMTGSTAARGALGLETTRETMTLPNERPGEAADPGAASAFATPRTITAASQPAASPIKRI